MNYIELAQRVIRCRRWLASYAARVSRSSELDIDWTVSETLGMLKTSLGNLKRLGFKLACKNRVFVWSE